MLTHHKQVQDLADIIGDVEPLIPPSKLTYPFDYLYLHIQNFDGQHLNALDRQLLASGQQTRAGLALETLRMQTDDEELQDVIDDILTAKPGYRPSFPRLSAIGPKLKPIKYLWHGWVPEGYITMLFGYGGTGKTYTALKLAQAIIHDQPAPDGQRLTFSNSRNVIHVDGEDFIRGYYQRAKKWGINTDFITPFLVDDGLIDLGNQDYQDHLVHLVDAVSPSLITIDSLTSIHMKGERKRTDVTAILHFLHKVAQYANCGLVLLHHPRKPPVGVIPRPLTMHDLSGSGQLTIIPRSILGIDYVDDDLDGPRRLKVMKNNFTKHPRPIGFKLISTDDPQVAEMKFGRLSDFLPQPDPTETEICADWLIAKLQHGPQAYSVLKQQAQVELGYNETMLHRARKLILTDRIRDTVGKHTKGNKWELVEAAEAVADEPNEQSKVQTCVDWLMAKLQAGPQPYADLKKKVEVELGYNESLLQRARKQLGDKIKNSQGKHKQGNEWLLTKAEKPSDLAPASEAEASERQDEAESNKTQTCVDWLMAKLLAGPQPYAALKKKAGVELGYNESLLQRARKQLGDKIEDTLGPRAKGNKWRLAQWYRDTMEG